MGRGRDRGRDRDLARLWGTVGNLGKGQRDSHLGRRLAQLRAQSRVLERLSGLVLAQAKASEERQGV